MKLVSHENLQSSQPGHVRVSAQWRDQMRNPLNVEIVIKRGTLAQDGARTLAEGDAGDIAKMMGEFANIAWEMGWRPRGLLASLPAFVQAFKLPPAA